MKTKLPPIIIFRQSLKSRRKQTEFDYFQHKAYEDGKIVGTSQGKTQATEETAKQWRKNTLSMEARERALNSLSCIAEAISKIILSTDRNL